jgi:hypothetical protein
VRAAGRVTLPRSCRQHRPGQALDRSRGAFTTEIHLKTDFDGHMGAFDLTAGRIVMRRIFPSCSAARSAADIRPAATRSYCSMIWAREDNRPIAVRFFWKQPPVATIFIL